MLCNCKDMALICSHEEPYFESDLRVPADTLFLVSLFSIPSQLRVDLGLCFGTSYSQPWIYK
jgi:hypothetical protein